jgi:hypothetical protein
MDTMAKDSSQPNSEASGLRPVDLSVTLKDTPKETNNHPEKNEFAPGIPWFFYWKVHPSQWKTRLQEWKSKGIDKIAVPLYWAHHARIDSTNVTYDFGVQKSETDLKELNLAIKALKLKTIFILPVGPMPFFVNGGVPASLIKNKSYFADGRSLVFVEPQTKKLVHYPSFFAASIFKEYCNWVQHLGNYLAQSSVSDSVFVADCGYLDAQGIYRSLAEDFGIEMQKKWKAHQKRSPNMSAESFQEEVLKLYRSVAREMLGALWGGEVRMALLGQAPELLLTHLHGYQQLEINLAKELKQCLQLQIHPILLPESQNSGPRTHLAFLYEKMCSESYLQSLFGQSIDDVSQYAYRAWTAATVVGDAKLIKGPMLKEGLESVGQNEFQGHLQIVSEAQLARFLKSPDEDDDWWTKPIIAPVAIENDNAFHSLLTHFLSGGKVLINVDTLSAAHLRKVELFVLENQLKESLFNAPLKFRLLTLGDGQLILYEGKDLSAIKLLHTKMHFWSVMFAQMQRHHLPLNLDKEMGAFWMERKTSPRELNYSSFRRLIIVNFSFNTKQAAFFPNKSYAFSKIVEQSEITIQQAGSGASTKIIMGPRGYVVLEFGHIVKI